MLAASIVLILDKHKQESEMVYSVCLLPVIIPHKQLKTEACT